MNTVSWSCVWDSLLVCALHLNKRMLFLMWFGWDIKYLLFGHKAGLGFNAEADFVYNRPPNCANSQCRGSLSGNHKSIQLPGIYVLE